MREKLENTKSMVLLVWMVGAGVIGLGIGALFMKYIYNYALWIIIVGLVVHAWAMYKIYIQ